MKTLVLGKKRRTKKNKSKVECLTFENLELLNVCKYRMTMRIPFEINFLTSIYTLDEKLTRTIISAVKKHVEKHIKGKILVFFFYDKEKICIHFFMENRNDGFALLFSKWKITKEITNA